MAKNPVRDRTGSIMVELDPEERAMLEMLKAKRASEVIERASLSTMIRGMIRAEFRRQKLTLEGE